MARFRCSASTSLNWGEGWFYFSFYSVQDRSLVEQSLLLVKSASHTTFRAVPNLLRGSRNSEKFTELQN